MAELGINMTEPPLHGDVTSRQNQHPFAHSFAVAGVALLVVLVVLFVGLGPPTAYGAGYVTARLAFPLAVAALITAFIARSSARKWSWWRYTFVVVPIGLLLSLIVAVGSVSGG